VSNTEKVQVSDTTMLTQQQMFVTNK